LLAIIAFALAVRNRVLTLAAVGNTAVCAICIALLM